MSRRLTAIITLAVLLSAAAAEAQEAPGTRVVTIVNADSVSGEVVDGQRLRHLLGNVHLRQDDTDLRARRATQFLDRDVTLFEGDVRIFDATDTLRANRVSYDARTRIGHARGAVRLSDAEAVLYSDSLVFYRLERRALFQAPVRLEEREGGGVLTSRRGTYFTDRKVAFFHEDVVLEDSVTVLTSHAGRYGTEDKRADFTGDVFLIHEASTRLRADSLTHQRDTKVSEARGNVVVLRYGGRENADADAEPDTTRRNLLFGGYAFHDETDRYSRIERGAQPYDPLAARLRTDSLGATDTLLVRSIVFDAFELDAAEVGVLDPGASLTRIIGTGEVNVASDRLGAVADSVVVDRIEFDDALGPPARDETRLYREPRAWLNNRGSELFTQISGDTLRVTARGEAIDSVWAHGHAFSVRPDSVLERNNQMRGRQMLAIFRDDSLRQVHVWPNAEVILFRADDDGNLHGGLQLSGDSLTFVFEGDDIRRMKVDRDIEGTYYDAGIIPSPFRLEGPEFRPADRPTIADLLRGRPPLDDPFRRPVSGPPIALELPVRLEPEEGDLEHGARGLDDELELPPAPPMRDEAPDPPTERDDGW